VLIFNTIKTLSNPIATDATYIDSEKGWENKFRNENGLNITTIFLYIVILYPIEKILAGENSK